MNSKLNEQGPDRILLCSDDVLAAAVRITDIYNYQRFWAEIYYGTIADYGVGYGYGFGSGIGFGSGSCGNGRGSDSGRG
jgi:hypothetical protein